MEQTKAQPELSKTAVKAKLVVCFLIATVGLVVPLRATTVQHLSFDDLVSKANTIVIGRILDSQTSWTKDGKLILTQTTVEVQEGLKGTPAKTVTVTTIGGQIGSTILHVSGMPAFVRDETAVIFLERSGAYSTVLGLNQGKFSINNGEVSNSNTGLTFSDGAAVKPVRMPLDEFKLIVRKHL